MTGVPTVKVRTVRSCVTTAATLAAVLWACAEPGPPSPGTGRPTVVLEDAGPLSVRVQEVWNLDIGDVGSITGIAPWDDGAAWLGSRRSMSMWGVAADGTGLSIVDQAGTALAEIGPVRNMAAAEGSGVLVLGERGVAFFSGRREPATVVKHPDSVAVENGSARGLAVYANGDHVISTGKYPSQPHSDFALHRYDRRGRHVASWHPAVAHEDWRATLRLSGGPVATMRNGDLLMSDVAPFRITRYLGGLGDSSVVIVEDESVVSSSQLQRALAPDDPGVTYQFQWSRTVFVDEMDDGSILSIAHIYPENRLVRHPHTLWVLVSAEGEIIARTMYRDRYQVEARAGPGDPGEYFARRNDDLVKLAVSVQSPGTGSN